MPKESKPERLRRLVALIEDQVDYDVGALKARLQQDEKAKFTFVTGAYAVQLAGVRGTATMNDAAALRSWCRAARRALVQLEA